jgi:hypothetical protein
MAEHDRLPFRKRRCRLEAAPPARDHPGARNRWFYRKSSSPNNDSKDARGGDVTPSQAAAALPRREIKRSWSNGRAERAGLPRSTGSKVVLLKTHAGDGSVPSERAAHKFGRAGDFEASYAGVIAGQITRREFVAQY